MNRTEQDKINRKEANQRYYQLEENKQQKRDYMKEYTKRDYVKAYNGVDMLTIMGTEKSIKKHAYDKMKEVIDDKNSNN